MLLVHLHVYRSINPLPHMAILGSTNSAANKRYDVKNMDKWGYNYLMGRKHCGKRRNCSLQAISSFPTMFSKAVCC